MPDRRRPVPGLLRALIAAALAVPPLAAAVPASAGEEPAGARIYRERCASCHGANGEGTEDEYPQPLAGDRSVGQLARYIARTMPADDPGACEGEDAEAVAAFIHEAFYSPAARARNRPARIELSRLTVGQYRNAVADLIGTFRGPGADDGRRGLRGEYFNARGFRGNRRVIERIDPEVRFDFGTAAPAPEGFDPSQFSIRWEGSVLAPETGEYEFVLRTDQAARLWVNDPGQPLIDAWVRSGDDVEHRAAIALLGGRSYALRLEFSKAKQGVDDSDKAKKPPEVPASIALAWRPPGGSEAVIPERHLSPSRSPERFVSTAPFPPDDRSIGYERGTTVSKAWDEATTEAAIEVGGHVASRLRELSGVADDAPDRADRLREFAARFVERAFRRPLDEEQRRLYVDRQFDGSSDPETAVKRVVLLALKSPRFLYLDLDGRLDGYDVASRLSFGLWDSLPDAPLLEAAASGGLATREQVAAQAERMLADPRTRVKVRELLHRWLKVDQARDLAKDARAYPGFDAALIGDLRTSLDLTLDDVVWGDAPDLRRLLTGDETYLNGRLARFYGLDLPDDAPFARVRFEPEVRAGVVSHPYVLASFAYDDASSPIHRGVLLARGVLGRTLRPPPDAFTPLPAELHPELTTRERVELQTRPEACADCHGLINPLGFALEQFDAVGRFRLEENGRPIDAAGRYEPRSGEPVSFSGARELAAFLAGSEEVAEAFVVQVFHHLVKQPVAAYGPDCLTNLRKSFAENDYNVRRLLVDVLAASALVPRGPDPSTLATASASSRPQAANDRE